MPELSEDQKQLLLYAHSSAECRPPVVVIDRAFPELAETAWAECQKLLASDVLPNFTSTDNTDSVKTEGIFRHAAVGSGPSSRVDLRHRSDLHCWVTPQLCKEYQLSGLQMLIKGLIKMCVPLKTSLNLNSDYSVQLAYYVSVY